jgi:hypothetical protein
MKRWALLVALLYALALVTLTLPVLYAAFGSDFKFNPYAISAGNWLIYWGWVGVMFASQLCLLTVPVKVSEGRPVSRRSLLWPIIAGGLLTGAMVTGAIFCVLEFLYRGEEKNWQDWGACIVGAVSWIAWTLVFRRHAESRTAEQVVDSQRRFLLRGSILELLIAVPTHIVARYRHYCCAGFMTFVGLTFGIAVMLFSFGPGVFYLFSARWQRLHPAGR